MPNVTVKYHLEFSAMPIIILVFRWSSGRPIHTLYLQQYIGLCFKSTYNGGCFDLRFSANNNIVFTYHKIIIYILYNSHIIVNFYSYRWCSLTILCKAVIILSDFFSLSTLSHPIILYSIYGAAFDRHIDFNDNSLSDLSLNSAQTSVQAR